MAHNTAALQESHHDFAVVIFVMQDCNRTSLQAPGRPEAGTAGMNRTPEAQQQDEVIAGDGGSQRNQYQQQGQHVAAK